MKIDGCSASETSVWHNNFNESEIYNWSSFSKEHGLFYTVDLFNKYDISACNRCKLNGQIFKIAFIIKNWREK